MGGRERVSHVFGDVFLALPSQIVGLPVDVCSSCTHTKGRHNRVFLLLSLCATTLRACVQRFPFKVYVVCCRADIRIRCCSGVLQSRCQTPPPPHTHTPEYRFPSKSSQSRGEKKTHAAFYSPTERNDTPAKDKHPSIALTDTGLHSLRGRADGQQGTGTSPGLDGGDPAVVRGVRPRGLRLPRHQDRPVRGQAPEEARPVPDGDALQPPVLGSGRGRRGSRRTSGA